MKSIGRSVMPKPTQLPVSKKLNIAIVGAGGIGSALAFQMVRIGGHSVTAIARPESQRLQQLERDAGIVDVTGERAPASVADALDERIAYDLVVVTLQAHRLDAILPTLERSRATGILLMFNNQRCRSARGLRTRHESVAPMPRSTLHRV
jgi:2-dehydropantoate 2-reductase